MLTYNNLKEKPKEFLAATGLTAEEFEILLPVFRQKYANLLVPGMTRKGTPRQHREEGGIKERLLTDEDKLYLSWSTKKYIRSKPCIDCNLV